MATDPQIAANRENAKRSTGPRTAAGKRRSRRNAFRHGIFAEEILIPGEDRNALKRLRTHYRRRMKPRSPWHEEIIEELTIAVWQCCRLRRIEAELLRASILSAKRVQQVALRDKLNRPPNHPKSTTPAAWALDVSIQKLDEQIAKHEISLAAAFERDASGPDVGGKIARRLAAIERKIERLLHAFDAESERLVRAEEAERQTATSPKCVGNAVDSGSSIERSRSMDRPEAREALARMSPVERMLAESLARR